MHYNFSTPDQIREMISQGTIKPFPTAIEEVDSGKEWTEESIIAKVNELIRVMNQMNGHTKA